MPSSTLDSHDGFPAGESLGRRELHGASLSDEDADDEDYLGSEAVDQETISADPFNSAPSAEQSVNILPFDQSTPLTFYRASSKGKRKTSPSVSVPRLNISPYAFDTRGGSPAKRQPFQSTRQLSDDNDDDAIEAEAHANGSTSAYRQDTKDFGGHDWYVEGPGRRVGYDDLTAIDWIFEYAKERQRLRVLRSSATGILGYLRQIADASQIWWILIFTGMLTGIIAASIDISSDWLADLKRGYCMNGSGGGKFYLNRAFCCWGHDELAQCRDWVPWSKAFGVGNASGGWIIEYVFFVIFSVAFAACASYLVQKFAKYAKHSGIPEIKTVLGGFVIRRFLGTWTLVVKSLGLCLAVASGLWLGKEGPLVHVACCCANLFLKIFPTLSSNEARKREVLSAAAAAGISVAFGAPLGGVLFSLEQLSYFFPDKTMWQSFVCAMIAAVSLQLLNPFRTGKLVLYQVTYHSGWHAFDLAPFILLGIIGGLYGGFFIKLNMKIAAWRRSRQLFMNPVVEVAAVATISALINYPNSFMRAQSSEVVYALFAECSELPDEQLGLCGRGGGVLAVIGLLLSAAFLGFLLATISFGLQLPAGIILPSMAIGALYGRAVGLLVRTWHESYPDLWVFSACEPDVDCVTAGTYAIIGAASALAGATRMTVSIVVIMFELTGALSYVLPIMISVMIGKWVGDAMGKRGIYESWIHFNEYPFLDNSDDFPIPDVAVSNIMTRIEDLFILSSTGHTVASLEEALRSQPYRGFPVVSEPREGLLLGYISRTELAFALKMAVSRPRNLLPSSEAFFSHQPLADPRKTLDLRPWMDQTPITLGSKSSLQLTVNMFQKLGLRYVLFCDRGTLQGLLTKKDVWYVLNGSEEGRAPMGTGVLREQDQGEEQGLLHDGDGGEYRQTRQSIRN